MSDVDARAARALAVAVVVPPLAGAAVSAAVAALEPTAPSSLPAVLGLYVVVVALAHAGAVLSLFRLARGAASASTLASSATALAALRVLAWAAVATGFFWPPARQSLVAVAAAIVDAGATATAVVVVAGAAHGRVAGRAVVVALGYGAYRVGFALVPWLSAGAAAPSESTTPVVHAVVAVVVVGAVAVEFARASRRFRDAP